MNISSFCQEHRTENVELYVRTKEEAKRFAGYKSIGEICPVCMAVLIRVPAIPTNAYYIEQGNAPPKDLQAGQLWKVQPKRYVTKPSSGLKNLS